MYFKGTRDKISKTLKKRNIHTIFNSVTRKICTVLRTPQQTITNETTDIYEIPCTNYYRTYIDLSKRRIQEGKK